MNAHAYDIARSGYVNLLQPQDRRSRKPGDSAEAVAARRRFLDAGHEEPITRAIVAMMPLESGDALLDAGCGEGHHLAAFRRAYGVDAHGIDISVPAIDLAARRSRDMEGGRPARLAGRMPAPQCQWIVANADRFIPYEDASFDAVTSITARLNPSEFHRVLAPGGTLLVAIAGADDLIELRAGERDRVDRTVEMFAAHFTLARHVHVRHVAHLDDSAIADVMSSSYRRVARASGAPPPKGAPEARTTPVTLSRDLLLFSRNAGEIFR